MTTRLERRFERRDTAANWTSGNPILHEGEWALETDTRRWKCGDGATAWNSLAYFDAELATKTGLTGTYAAPQKRDVVYLGTSVTYNGGNADFTGTGGFLTTAGFAVNVQALTHWRLNPRNAGVGGDFTGQMLARLSTDVLAYNPGVCVFEVGPNDSKGGVSVVTTQANITAILDALQAINCHCVLLTITPSDLINTTAEQQHLSAVNRWIRNLPNGRRGVTVVDVYRHVAAPGSIAWQSGYSTDLTHPNPVGALEMAKPVAAAINAIFPKVTPLTFGGDPYELLPNPRMTGNSSGVATSVTRTGGTGTATKVARTDGIPGEWQQWDQSSGTNYIIQEVTTGFTVGQAVYGMMEFETDAAGWASTSNQLALQCRDNANTDLGTVVTGGGQPVECQASSGVWLTKQLVIPTGTTKIRLYHFFQGAGITRIGTMGLRVVGT